MPTLKVAFSVATFRGAGVGGDGEGHLPQGAVGCTDLQVLCVLMQTMEGHRPGPWARSEHLQEALAVKG